MNFHTFVQVFGNNVSTPDQPAKKYYSISPYAFCAGNPVNFIDLDGMDVWNVYEDGTIEWVKQRKRDIVRTMNMDGDIIKRLSFKGSNLSKGVLTVSDKNYNYFNVSNPDVAQSLFEFLASPSNWGEDDCMQILIM